jgi:hypothetical protein
MNAIDSGSIHLETRSICSRECLGGGRRWLVIVAVVSPEWPDLPVYRYELGRVRRSLYTRTKDEVRRAIRFVGPGLDGVRLEDTSTPDVVVTKIFDPGLEP